MSCSAIQGNCIPKSPSLAQCVANSQVALSLETPSPSQEPCSRTETVHHCSKNKMHARLCVLRASCSCITDITLPRSGPTSVCIKATALIS